MINDSPEVNSLEKVFENCCCFHDIINSVDNISAKNTKEVDVILLYSEILNWDGQISAADELDSSEKDVLNSYISSKINNSNTSN